MSDVAVIKRYGNPTVQVRLPRKEIADLVTIAAARALTPTELCRKYIRAGALRDANKLAKRVTSPQAQ